MEMNKQFLIACLTRTHVANISEAGEAFLQKRHRRHAGARGCEKIVNGCRKCGEIRKVTLSLIAPLPPPTFRAQIAGVAVKKKKEKKIEKNGATDNFQSRSTTGFRSARLLWRNRNTIAQWQVPIWPRCQGEKRKEPVHSQPVDRGACLRLCCLR